MSLIQVRIVKESWHVTRRLAEMELALPKLLKVRSIALSAAADATPNHPANAAGTFAYHQGTWGLRNEFVAAAKAAEAKASWERDTPNGVEVIRNDGRKLMVGFANVDICCDDKHSPRPRSRKGSGAERLYEGLLFSNLPQFVRKPDAVWQTYYLMVDEKGAAEISRPIIERGTFKNCIERIYLSDGHDLGDLLRDIGDDDVADDFDPKVARR